MNWSALENTDVVDGRTLIGVKMVLKSQAQKFADAVRPFYLSKGWDASANDIAYTLRDLVDQLEPDRTHHRVTDGHLVVHYMVFTGNVGFEILLNPIED